MIASAATALLQLVLLQSVVKLDPPPPPDFKTPVDYAAWLERQVVRGQSREENAAELYSAIFGSADPYTWSKLPFEGPKTQEKPVERAQPWEPKEHPNWEAAHEKTKSTVDQFRRAAAKPFAWWGIRYSPDEQSQTLQLSFMPELGALRNLAKGAAENAWRAEKGKIDVEEFVKTYQALLDLARHLERNPAIIVQLVACAVRAMAYEDLLLAADPAVLEPAGRSAVLSMLRIRDEPMPPIRFALNAELASGLDAVQHVVLKKAGVADVDEKLGPIRCDGPRASDALRRYFDSIASEAEKPYALANYHAMNSAQDRVKSADLYAAVLATNLSRVCAVRTRCEAERRGTRLVYELFAYQDKHNKWPASLSELPPDLPRTATIDPFADKPFVYRLEDGKPLLYSVAKNGKDDGGTTHDRKWIDDENADHIVWPRQ